MAKKKQKRLYRVEEPDAKLFGVCGGIAEYFDVDPTIVRVAFALLTIPAGTAIIVYIVCAFCMPTKSEIEKTTKK